MTCDDKIHLFSVTYVVLSKVSISYSTRLTWLNPF